MPPALRVILLVSSNGLAAYIWERVRAPGVELLVQGARAIMRVVGRHDERLYN